MVVAVIFILHYQVSSLLFSCFSLMVLLEFAKVIPQAKIVLRYHKYFHFMRVQLQTYCWPLTCIAPKSVTDFCKGHHTTATYKLITGTTRNLMSSMNCVSYVNGLHTGRKMHSYTLYTVNFIMVVQMADAW